ncbi:MAG TPA: wax ester/triacylglycerol synthase family O-acyltransferase [Solirubrobacteraceae bacterium]|nr:wax ester/triacylglycerol synthase family O-acyltransferase [Solirubrobacteraceae bacterium]
MAQEHFDRLTAIDASFLAQEGASSHMHIGALTVLEGPPPPFGEFLDIIRGRLHLVPRYRQKLSFPPIETGRPVWVDDPDFNIEYHVRQTALPRPGSQEQLFKLVSRIFSQQLDRSKPLWEMWVIEGLEGGRWALISKTHHSVIDGISGVDLATVMFDLTPETREVEHPDEAWEPAAEPTPAALVASGAVGIARTAVGAAGRLVRLATRPQEAVSEVRDGLEGIGEILWAGLNPAPDTPLNVEIGPHRRYRVVQADLADFKLIKDELGGTVNDVVLAVVSGALREWLRSRGVRTEGLELRALVPVSVRAADAGGELGNQIVAMRGPLPVYVDDPVARLKVVRQGMGELKESKQAVGAAVLAGAQGFAPPTVLAQASRLNFSTRLFNLIVTNVPGPQFPLYVAGRRMDDLYPIAFLPKDHALALAIMSYDGGLNFGLLGDYDALPDIDAFADGLRGAIDELLEIARAKRGSTNGRARVPAGS